ncbi:molybdopterin-dependent oxidoreductase [Specibacter cremeus]|uniref:molybdopterin-dependent oxidoreductase n=1 Tax=Specibacter cremeus TaxID=1629051 RepID=UPI001F0C0B3C|nr:molybdopterin-dependent oxidoreductase [Specibacter cremeus]
MDRLTTKLQARMDALGAASASPLRGRRLTVILGRWLGAAFVICFLTGLYSHLLQQPPAWMVLLPRPVWLYRLTQGVHVATGIGSIPLLLAKLWSVFPELLRWPPIRSVLHALERASIALLVASSLVEVGIGLVNTFEWYPWPFPFKTVHYWLAWVIVSSLALHVAIKLPVIAAHWRRGPAESADPAPAGRPNGMPAEPAGAASPGWNRRALLAAVAAATGAAVLTTAGQSFGGLAGFNVFAPRRQGTGPQRLPVTRTAAEAGVATTALATGWTLTVTYRQRQETFSLARLRALPQHTSELPIACVEGWSQDALWRGVRIRDLLATVGAPADSDARVHSLEQHGNYAASTLPAAYSRDDLTLLALELNGAPLDLDHGYPARVMAPGRPGVLQTKWVRRIEVLG